MLTLLLTNCNFVDQNDYFDVDGFQFDEASKKCNVYRKGEIKWEDTS